MSRFTDDTVVYINVDMVNYLFINYTFCFTQKTLIDTVSHRDQTDFVSFEMAN